MYVMRSYVEGCNAITPDIEAEDLDEIKEKALERLKWIEDRAFGAEDTAELLEHEDRGMYEDLVGEIGSITKINKSAKVELGPLPCGYIIEIEKT